MKRLVLAGLLGIGLSTPGLTDTAFYVALDTTSNQCRIMVTEPDGETMRMLGSGPFDSYAEAEEAMQEMTECSR